MVMISLLLRISTILALVRKAMSQTQGEPVTYLRVSQHFKSTVQKFSDNFATPRYLLHGGWFKALDCQDQYILAHFYQNTGPAEASFRALDLGVSYFRWDKSLFLPCGNWVFVVHAHELIWSSDSQSYKGPVRQVFHHPTTFTDTPSDTDPLKRVLLRFTISTSDATTIYYKFRPNILMTHLFYYIDASLDPLDKVVQLAHGGLKLEESIEVRLFKYFKEACFEDEVKVSEVGKLSRISQSGLELRATKVYRLHQVHSHRAWKPANLPQDRCSDFKIFFNVVTGAFGFNSNTIEFSLENSDPNSLLGDQGSAVLTIIGGGKQLMSPEIAELKIKVGTISQSVSKTLFSPVDGRISRVVVQLKACFFSDNLYIRTILYVNDQHKLFGPAFKRPRFTPSNLPWDLVIRKTTNVTVGEESQVFVEQLRMDRGALDLSFVDRVRSASCLFSSPAIQPDFSFIQYCLVCKSKVYNVGGQCLLPNPPPTPALNSSCETYHSNQECIGCTAQSNLLYNKFGYVCYKAENCLAPNNIPGTGAEEGKVCSDVPPATPVICNTFQNVTTANSCECKITGCSVCQESLCDDCKSTNEFVQVDHGKSACVSEVPVGYGVDGSNQNIIRKCEIFGCTDCSFNHLMCIQCDMQLAPYCEKYFTCDATCLTCSDPYANGCLSCASGSYLYETGICGSCTESDRTLDPLTKICIKCDPNCKTCQEKPTVCMSCKGEDFLDLNTLTCQSSCGTGYFSTTLRLSGATEDARVCKRCHSKCSECTNEDDCSVCKTTQLITPTCRMPMNYNCSTTPGLSIPPPGKYYYTYTTTDSTNITNTISYTLCDGNCSTGCSVCENNGSCYSCNGGYKLVSPNICTQCDTLNGDLVVGTLQDCISCENDCQRCQDTTNNCIECKAPASGTGLFNIGSSKNKRSRCRSCSSESSKPYSYVLEGSECLRCNSNCDTCGSNRSDCLTCIPNYYYYESDHRCDICKEPGVFKNGDYCKPCASNCFTCSITETNCTACSPLKPEMYLYENNSCGTCSEPGFTISRLDTTEGPVDTCIKCSTNCKSCSFRAEFCTSCPGQLSLYENNTCGTCADQGVILVDNMCILCDKTCAACEKNKTNCLKCASGLVMNSNSTCGNCKLPGYYINRIDPTAPKCTKCPDMCLTCINGVSCLTCAEGLFQYLNGSCGSCLEADHAKSFGETCMPCHTSCETCRGILETQCSSCTQDKYVDPAGRCVDKIPLSVVSTGYNLDLKQASVIFDQNIQSAAGATVEQDAEIMIYSTSDKSVVFNTVNTSSLSVPLKDISKLGPIDSFKVVSIKIEGDSIRINLDFQAEVKEACLVMRIARAEAITAENKPHIILKQNTVVVPGITVLKSSMDSILQNSAANVQATVNTLTTAFLFISLPQAFILMKVFKTVDYYIYIECDYPVNFGKFLEVISKDVMDYVPNLITQFSDDYGDPVFPRFKEFGLDIHVFKNLGRHFTLIIAVVAIKILAEIFRFLLKKTRLAKFLASSSD